MIVVVREDEVLLMLIPKTNEIYPLAGIALNASQNSKKNLENTIGSFLFSEDGKVWRIKSIKRKGFLGDTFRSKIKGVIFGVYSLDVKLEELDTPIDRMISIASDYIERDLSSDAPIFESASLNKNSVMDLVGKAKSAKDVFQAIQMPKVEDCLDML